MNEGDLKTESGEEDIDEQGRNPTQRHIDDETSPDVENEPSPHQGEEGTEPV